jgi:hypothetical protein
MNDVKHARVLIDLVTKGIFVTPCPTPWSVDKRENFYGPNTEHTWQLWDADDHCLEYLPASVDGSAFVEWVNGLTDRAVQMDMFCKETD